VVHLGSIDRLFSFSRDRERTTGWSGSGQAISGDFGSVFPDFADLAYFE
jgi:hypothetical protein